MHGYGGAELSDSKGITMNTTPAIAVAQHSNRFMRFIMRTHARTHARPARCEFFVSDDYVIARVIVCVSMHV